jgi:hypothetical protein
MKKDEIASTVKGDTLILQFGADILEKTGVEKAQYVRQRMRQLARLLIQLNSKAASTMCLKDYIDAKWFDHLLDGVKGVCQFDPETRNNVKTPSLALKLGHSLKRCGQLMKALALREKNIPKLKEVKMFLELLDTEWSTKISSRSLESMGAKKYNKVDYLPLADDMEKLRRHLVAKIQNLSKVLQQSSGRVIQHNDWLDLAKATLARIIIFNKRRYGETSKLEVELFQGRPNWANCSSALKASLTPLELRLSERYHTITQMIFNFI